MLCCGAPSLPRCRGAGTTAEVEALYRRFRALDRNHKGYISPDELMARTPAESFRSLSSRPHTAASPALARRLQHQQQLTLLTPLFASPQAVPELAINPLVQRIVQLFENVNFKDFCLLLSNFRRVAAHARHQLLPAAPFFRPVVGLISTPATSSENATVTVVSSPALLWSPTHSERSTPDDRFRFVFNVYDVDGDGFISRSDMLTIMRNRAGSQLTCAALRGEPGDDSIHSRDAAF